MKSLLLKLSIRLFGMGQTSTFGIVGGSGATGRAVVSELVKSSDGEILIGGRDLARATASAAKLGGRISAAHLDVLDAGSLDEFCGRCSIIVNCAGPVMVLQDRVAQAAFRSRCHYVDVAGLGFVKERMLPHCPEIAELGLSYVVSAGWAPGLTELLPVYAHAQARAKMDSIESLTVYFADSGAWTDNALRDGVWYLRKVGLAKPCYFRKGEWVRAKMSESSRKVDLGGPIGLRRFSMFSMPELNEVGRRFTDCDVFTYSYLAGIQNAVAAATIALAPLPEQLGVRLLRNIFRRNRLPVAGFVVAQITGRSQGRGASFSAQAVFQQHRDYWINGLVPAQVAAMISEGAGVQPGVHFLADAVDPIAFMADLRKSGVEQTESWGL
jgi:saccharopine dehydrogenase (NAD+, L-lysine-forming)